MIVRVDCRSKVSRWDRQGFEGKQLEIGPHSLGKRAANADNRTGSSVEMRRAKQLETC